MNPLLHWLTSPEWTHVIGALLHSLWQGAIIAIALAVLMRRFANPATRYRCALVTLGLVVIAGIVTWAVLNTPKPAISVTPHIPVTQSTVAPFATAALNPDSADKIVAIGRMSAPPAPRYWIALLALVWMFGAVVMLLRAGIKVAGAENLRRACQPLDDERMVALAAEARRAVGLARQIRVAVTDKLTSPAVVGVIVPTLILPLSLFTALTPEQIRFILLHELAHIRRGDYFANLFQLFAEALLFFNPAVWWVSHQIRREREACCDALAIESSGAPADYARTLVHVAENILQPATTAALAFGDGQREPSSLTDRVQRLLVPGYRPALRLTWRAMLASLIVGGTLLVLSAVGTRSTVGAMLSPRESNSTTTNDTHIGVEPASILESKIKSNQEHKIAFSAQSASSLEQTNVAPVSDNRRAIIRKLHTIRLDQVPFDQQPLREVIRVLSADTLAHDPWGQGINFTLNGVSAPVAPAFDWEASFVAEDKNPVLVTIKPEIRGATLGTILDTIVRGADKPIKYSILGDAVAFSLKSDSDHEPLPMRVFTVDLKAFYAAVRKSAGLPETTTGTNLTGAIRPFFAKAGVDFDPDSGKSYFFSDSRGQILVHATLPELDAIQALLQPLTGPPVVTRFFRLAPDFLSKATNGLTPEISSVFATNPAAGFQALFESTHSGDPRRERLMYVRESGLVVARSTETYLNQFEAAMKFLLDTNSGPPFRSAPASSSAVDLSTRTFMVGPVELARALGRVGPVQVTNAAEMVQAFMVKAGVDMRPPKTVVFKDTLGLLMVRATKAELDTIEKFLGQANQGPASGTLPPVNTGDARALIPVPKTNLATSVGDSSTNLQIWVCKVDANAMAQVLARQYGTNAGSRAEPITDSSLLLPEIQKLLASVGVDLQPPKTVFFNEPKGELLVYATQVDLDTIEKILAQSNQGAASGTLPPGKARAMIPMPKTNIATSVSDGSTNLQLRVYAVDGNAMVRVLERQRGTNAGSGAKPITDGSQLLPDIRKLFASVGVDLQPPKSVFFNEPKGQLLVYATLADLDTIEHVVQVLNDQPPQVNIKVKWVEIPQSLVSSMLPEFLTNILPSQTFETQGFSFILTTKQMAEVRKRIDSRDGMTLLSEGDVTTLSDRQCQIQTTEMKTIVTGIKPKALTRPGVTSTNHTGSAFLETELTPFGPVLDVIPTVSRDQANISLRVIATLTEFLGYDKAATEVPIYVNGKKEKTTLPLPKYRLQQMTNDCVILDGQTLMLGNLPMTEISKQPNGEFLTADVTGNKTNFLFVFVTPTLIDPAGNRVNSDRKSPPSSPPNSE